MIMPRSTVRRLRRSLLAPRIHAEGPQAWRAVVNQSVAVAWLAVVKDGVKKKKPYQNAPELYPSECKRNGHAQCLNTWFSS